MSLFREVLARERSREETSNNTLTQEVVDRLGELGGVVAPAGANIVEPKRASTSRSLSRM